MKRCCCSWDGGSGQSRRARLEVGRWEPPGAFAAGRHRQAVTAALRMRPRNTFVFMAAEGRGARGCSPQTGARDGQRCAKRQRPSTPPRCSPHPPPHVPPHLTLLLRGLRISPCAPSALLKAPALRSAPGRLRLLRCSGRGGTRGWTHTSAHTHIHAATHTQTRRSMDMHAHIHAYTYLSIGAHIHIRTSVHTYIHTHPSIHMRVYVGIHTYIHTSLYTHTDSVLSHPTAEHSSVPHTRTWGQGVHGAPGGCSSWWAPSNIKHAVMLDTNVCVDCVHACIHLHSHIEAEM